MRILLVLVILLLKHSSSAQDPTQKVKEIIREADEHQNPTEILEKLREAVPYLEDVGVETKASFKYHIGVAHGMLYNLDSSKYYFSKSIEDAIKINDTLTQIGSLNGLANLALIVADVKESQKNYETALELADSGSGENYVHWQSRLRGNLAGVFFEIGDPESALFYSKEALRIASMVSDSIAMANNLIQMGYCFDALYQIDSALIVNKRAATILEGNDQKIPLIFQYYNIANIYLSMDAWLDSFDYFKKCIDLSSEYNEYEVLAGSYNGLGELSLKQNNFEKAATYLQKAIRFSEENNLMPNLLRALKLNYQLEQSRGNLADAIDYLTAFYTLQDSIQDEESLKRVDEFKVKYETAKREKEVILAKAEIEKKEKQQAFLIIIIIVVVVFSMVAILLILQRFKLKKALLSQEIDTLRAKINLAIKSPTDDFSLDQINEGLHHHITEREFEILKLAVSDTSNNEIAEKAFISVNTVKFHLKRVYDKLGVSNRKEALQKITSK